MRDAAAAKRYQLLDKRVGGFAKRDVLIELHLVGLSAAFREAVEKRAIRKALPELFGREQMKVFLDCSQPAQKMQ
jgi:hypothetical protein